ncbi:MAG: hypothetical protein IPJ30_08950 [Acidobacteria bacterium]|nr:hypothetical protein [Acidobacteriota bacterium]
MHALPGSSRLSFKKIALQVRHWQSGPRFARLRKIQDRPDKGSMAMPHKRNPILSGTHLRNGADDPRERRRRA